MRRILCKIAEGEMLDLGDTTTLLGSDMLKGTDGGRHPVCPADPIDDL